jgi:STE24 endopeptidase
MVWADPSPGTSSYSRCCMRLPLWPLTWYRSYRLEREYELSQVSTDVWLRDYLKAMMLGVALAPVAGELIYLAMRTSPEWWWLAAVAGTLFLGVLTSIAPILILPLFHRSRPLARERLETRLLRLSQRAGLTVLGVYEWGLGEKTRRANAALVGAGPIRRILLSDTLLAGYTDDEIEVVLAHEMGLHLHRDVLKGLAAECVVLLASFIAAAVALRMTWKPLGLTSPSDVAGLPVVLLTGGAVSLLTTPVTNALSRYNERRADRFALDLTSRPDAFIAAMRRMAAQNLAEEHPSRTAFWFFHTHPRVHERIEQAKYPASSSRILSPKPSCQASSRIDSPAPRHGTCSVRTAWRENSRNCQSIRRLSRSALQ